MTVSRRDVVFGFGGLFIGGAMAVAGGLSYRAYRRSRRQQGRVGVVLNDDGGWMITEEERAAIATTDAVQ